MAAKLLVFTNEKSLVYIEVTPRRLASLFVCFVDCLPHRLVKHFASTKIVLPDDHDLSHRHELAVYSHENIALLY